MPVSKQDIKGNVGEHAFSLVATRAGFTVHGPDQDRHGWDRYVEIELPPDPSIPLDRQSAVLSASVQLKTTESRDFDDVALSVLRRMATDPNPWFIAFVVLDPELKATELHLVHVDDGLMLTVLARLRKAVKNGTIDTLHDQTSRVKFSDGVRLDPEDKDTLKATILSTVGDPLAYVERKTRAIKTLGYPEDGSTHSYSVTFGSGVTASQFADAMIGAGGPLRFSAMSRHDVRFGNPLLEETLGEGELEVVPQPMGKSRLAIETRAGKRAEMSMDLYAPPSAVPVEFRRLRFANTVVEILVGVWPSEPGPAAAGEDGSDSEASPAKATVKVSISVNRDLCRLEDLAAAADLVDVFDAGQDGLFVEVTTPEESFRAPCGLPSLTVSEPFRGLLRGARAGAIFARNGGFSISEDMVRPAEIVVIADNLDGLLVSTEMDDNQARIAVLNDEPFSLASVLFLDHFFIPLENHVLSVVIGVEGTPNKVVLDDKVLLVARGKVRVVRSRRMLHAAYDDLNPRFLYEVLDEESSKREDLGVVSTWQDSTPRPASS